MAIRTEQLIQILEKSLFANTVKFAERSLMLAQKKPLFVKRLLRIIGKNISNDVRLASAIALKNFIRKNNFEDSIAIKNEISLEMTTEIHMPIRRQMKCIINILKENQAVVHLSNQRIPSCVQVTLCFNSTLLPR